VEEKKKDEEEEEKLLKLSKGKISVSGSVELMPWCLMPTCLL
jgi:hypothetical protein